MRTCCLFLALIGAACGSEPDTHESVANEAMDLLDQVYEVLATVDDDESAAKAKTKLDEFVGQMTDIVDRAKALPKATAEQRKAIDEKMKPRAQAFMKKVQGLQQSLALHPELGGPLQKLGQQAERLR